MKRIVQRSRSERKNSCPASKRAHHLFINCGGMVGTAQGRLCPPYESHAFPRSSRNKSGFCCTGRSEKLNSTASSSASCVTHCQLGTTNRSRGPHSKVASPIRLRPWPSVGQNTVASV